MVSYSNAELDELWTNRRSPNSAGSNGLSCWVDGHDRKPDLLMIKNGAGPERTWRRPVGESVWIENAAPSSALREFRNTRPRG